MCQASSASSQPRTQKGGCIHFLFSYLQSDFISLTSTHGYKFVWVIPGPLTFWLEEPLSLMPVAVVLGGNGEPTGKLKFYWANLSRAQALPLVWFQLRNRHLPPQDFGLSSHEIFGHPPCTTQGLDAHSLALITGNYFLNPCIFFLSRQIQLLVKKGSLPFGSWTISARRLG